MPLLFGVTLFVSATLLFLVQPMVGRMVLPLLGGSPAVWNTCMVFFQALLLGGYWYSHKSTTRLPPTGQLKLHAGLLAATVVVLGIGAALSSNHSPVPIVKSFAPQGSDLPFFGVLLILTAAIGLPFFTLSTTAPLLQKWFAETGHPSAGDPYFLYAASNAGSLLSLLAYPFVVEPNLTLFEQAWMWAIGFGLLIALIFLCGRAVSGAPPHAAPTLGRREAAEPPPAWPTLLRWLFLAAVPSSLMLAVTTDVTTDMVSMPLLWVIPLALYLVTFVIVFAKSTPKWVHLAATLASPVLILVVMFIKTSENVGGINFTDAPPAVQIILHLLPFVTFFVVTLTCHGELARTRPGTRHLTTFYLTMSVGGVLGGLFNAFVAPAAFTFITEYPISLIGACLLLPPLSLLTSPETFRRVRSWTIWDAIVPMLFFALTRFLTAYWRDIAGLLWDNGVKRMHRSAATLICYGLPTMCSYFLVERPYRFGLAVAAIWLGTFLTQVNRERTRFPDNPEYRTVYERSFYGTMKIERNVYEVDVSDDEKHLSPPFRRLIHGTTVHGMQHFEADISSDVQALTLLGANTTLDSLALAWVAQPHFESPRREPLTYYHRTGPVGSIFHAFNTMNSADPKRNREVGCVGLGTGSLSAYARPGERMTFFEIDPTVRRLVEDPKPETFTYIRRARDQGCEIDFLMGDARLSLERNDRQYGLLLVDAFSSDSIPTHLLTVEAVKLYFDRLSDDGLLALHISNRYLMLQPVVREIVGHLGMHAEVMSDNTMEGRFPGTKPEFSGKLSSSWVIVSRRKEGVGPIGQDERWGPLQSNSKVGLWTDDYTPVTKALINGPLTLIGK